MDELLKGLSDLAGTFGLDVILIAAVVVCTFFLRLIFKPKKAWIPMMYAFIVGVVLGVMQIVLNGSPVNVWLRIIFGYPIAGIFAYMTYRKFLPNVVILKPKEDK
jgi:membrane-associated PAP2 superfamily phosphatase